MSAPASRIDLYDPNPSSWRRFLSGLYGGVVNFRNYFYRTGLARALPLPARVVSVGNLTVGGTGKTPMVMMLARELTSRGLCCAIVSRGYRGRASGPVNVVSDRDRIRLGPAEAGDEPYLMAVSLPGVPVLTGKRRLAAGREAIERYGARVLVMDDGYQHLGMARDVNLLLLDARKPWGNEHLLPAGPLREPKSEAGRASAFILTRAPESPTPAETELRREFPNMPIFRARHKPAALTSLDGSRTEPLEYLRERGVVAFCGLARPESFVETLCAVGAKPALMIKWPDHYRPKDSDLALVAAKSRDLGLSDVVTTAKDAVKLAGRDISGVNVWILQVEMEIIEGQEEFWKLVLGETA